MPTSVCVLTEGGIVSLLVGVSVASDSGAAAGVSGAVAEAFDEAGRGFSALPVLATVVGV